MAHQFGQFELDEAGRSLALQGRALDLQPKVFDLLVHLVRHAGRVVSKEELMEQLWPGVHVTESSLQRAVSMLRKALRKGGQEEALKNLADLPPVSAYDNVAKARAAATEREWAKVVKHLSAIADDALTPADCELWAFALECMGQPADAALLHRRAVEGYETAGQSAAASLCATSLGKIHLERGEAAVARGWLARAAALLRDKETGDEVAFLRWMQARFEAFEGRPDAALAVAQSGYAAAEAGGSVRLRALTLGYVGFFNISLGRTRLGLEQQDHAAALAMSTAVDPLTGGLIYCNILWSCRCFADWSRANQWVDGFETWCKANFAGTTAACELHRAEVLGAKGTLADALAAVTSALSKLPRSEPWALGDAHRVRGDIRAAIGDIEAAQEDYRAAYAAGWDGEPGNAVLLYEAGDVDGAISALDRVLSSVGWFGLQRRGWILAHKARICAHAGREEEARACLRMLAAEFDGWPSPAIQALATEAEALLAPDNANSSAIQLLTLARQLWTSIGLEHQAARVRLELAKLLHAKNDIAGAQVELRCARDSARRVGAKLLERQAAALTATVSR
jgi:tetratricopeptide (TPR) repeat protein